MHDWWSWTRRRWWWRRFCPCNRAIAGTLGTSACRQLKRLNVVIGVIFIICTIIIVIVV